MPLLTSVPIQFLRVPADEAESLYAQGMHIVVARSSVPTWKLNGANTARTLEEGHGNDLAAHAIELVRTTPSLAPDDDDIAWYLVDSAENRARVVALRIEQRQRPTSRAAQSLLDREGADQCIARGIENALHADRLPVGAPWPAWSTGEVLTVALVLDRHDILHSMGHNIVDALQRIDTETVNALPEIVAAVKAARHEHSLSNQD